MTIAIAMHLLNSGLAAIVMVLCISQSNWRRVNRVRNSRIIGMAILNMGVAWFSFVHRIEPFQPWVPFITVGLLFCIHGLKNDAMNEGPRQLAINCEEVNGG